MAEEILTPAMVLINQNAIEVYEKRMGLFHQQLVTLNTNLLILRRIAAYRFDLLLSEDDIFFRIVFTSLMQTSLLTVYKLYKDELGDNFRKFESEVRSLTRPEYQSVLDA